MRRSAAVILTALALAGCSSAPSTPAAVTRSPEPQSIADLAHDVGCASFTPTPKADLELFVSEGGTCTLPNGHTVTVRRFPNGDAMKNWWDVAAQFGADETQTATAGLVLFEPDDTSDLPGIKGALP